MMMSENLALFQHHSYSKFCNCHFVFSVLCNFVSTYVVFMYVVVFRRRHTRLWSSLWRRRLLYHQYVSPSLAMSHTYSFGNIGLKCKCVASAWWDKQIPLAPIPTAFQCNESSSSLHLSLPTQYVPKYQQPTASISFVIYWRKVCLYAPILLCLRFAFENRRRMFYYRPRAHKSVSASN